MGYVSDDLIIKKEFNWTFLIKNLPTKSFMGIGMCTLDFFEKYKNSIDFLSFGQGKIKLEIKKKSDQPTDQIL